MKLRHQLIPIVVLLLIALDQWSKYWVVDRIALQGKRPFLPFVLHLTYVRNYGAAFSILQNQQWFFALMTLLVIGAAVVYLWYHKDGSLWMVSSLILIIAGGLGNFIDRLRLGYVVDMIELDFIDFAIFNLADSFLSIGVVVMLIALWKEGDHASNS